MKNAHKMSFFSIKWSRKKENSCVQSAIMSTMCEMQKKTNAIQVVPRHISGWSSVTSTADSCTTCWGDVLPMPSLLHLGSTALKAVHFSVWWLTMSNLHRKRKMDNIVMSSGVKGRWTRGRGRRKVCVCVYEREGERERERGGGKMEEERMIPGMYHSDASPWKTVICWTSAANHEPQCMHKFTYSICQVPVRRIWDVERAIL